MPLPWYSWNQRPRWRRSLRRAYDAVHGVLSPRAPNRPLYNYLLGLHYFLSEMGRLPRDPRRADAVVQDLIFDRMVHDRWHPFQREIVDKAKAKAVAQRLDPRVRVAETVAVLDVPRPCRAADLERLLAPYSGGSFVAKPTHSCGGVVDLVNPNWRRQLPGMQRRLNQDYFYALRETQYRDIQRRIIVEERLGDSSQDLAEYKIHCAWGRTVGMQFDVGRHGVMRRAFIMLGEGERFDWVPHGFDANAFESAPPPPASWPLMRSIAATLCRPFDLVRIDLYEKNGAVYFGEFTLTPSAGMFYSRYPDIEEMFNETWRVGRAWHGGRERNERTAQR